MPSLENVANKARDNALLCQRCVEAAEVDYQRSATAEERRERTQRVNSLKRLADEAEKTAKHEEKNYWIVWGSINKLKGK